MSYLIDSHCHIHDRSVYEFALSRQKKQTEADFTPEKILGRMKKNNVKMAICVGTTHEDSLSARAFAEKHDNIYWSYGIHPEEAHGNIDIKSIASLFSSAAVLAPVVTELDRYGVASLPRPKGRTLASCAMPRKRERDTRLCLVAIGEVGLDYHSPDYDRSAQIKLLEQMLDLALKNDLPLIFHVRDAFDDFFAVLNNFHNIRGVVHSFSDTGENLEKSLSRGFYIGVNGLATFTDIPLPPLERTLLETDAPFLAPIPFRGQVNDPSHIRDIATFLAKKYDTTLDQVTEITTKNTASLFRMS